MLSQKISNPKTLSFFIAGIIVIWALWNYLPQAQRNLADATTYSFWNRRWGFDQLSYYPSWVGLICLAILSVWSSRSVSKSLYQGGLGGKVMHRLDTIFPKTFKGRIAVSLTLSLIAVLCYYAFRIEYILYGDQIKVAESIMENITYGSSKGSFLLFQWFDAWYVNLGWSDDTLASKLDSVAYTSMFFGGVFVFFSYHLACELFKKTTAKAVGLAIMIFSSNTFIFFGMNETYAPFYAMIPLTVFLLVRLMRVQKREAIIAYMMLFISLWYVMSYLHNMSSFLIPGMLVALLWKFRTSWKKYVSFKLNRSHLVLIAIGFLISLYFFDRYFDTDEELHWVKGFYLMPVWAPFAPDGFFLLDWRYIWDQINGMIYTSGLNIFLLLFMIVLHFKKSVRWTAITLYLSITSFLILVFWFGFQKHLGSADIDLLSYAPFFYNILCALFLLREFRFHTADPLTHFRITGFIVSFNVLHFILIVGTHTSDRSLAKFEDMILADKSKKYIVQTNPETTIGISIERGDLDRALYYFKRAYEKYNQDARSYQNYGGKLLDSRRPKDQQKKGAEILTECLKKFPFYDLSYQSLVLYYDRIQDFNRRDAVV